MSSQKQIDANRENGKKGGRPLATSTIITQKTKEYIAERVEEELEPIVSKALEQAKAGDKHAREFLFDRFMGKPTQSTEMSGKDGQDLIIQLSEVIAKKNDINTGTESDSEGHA